MAAKPVAKRRPPGATADRILKIAMELIAEQGFSATSTRQIAEILGLTNAAIYYHFRTKDDMLAALLRPAIDALRELVEHVELADPASRRVTAITGYAELTAKHERLSRIITQDPSLLERAGTPHPQDIYDRLAHAMLGEQELSTAARARFRAALSGIHAIFVYAGPDDDREVLYETAVQAASAVLSAAD